VCWRRRGGDKQEGWRGIPSLWFSSAHRKTGEEKGSQPPSRQHHTEPKRTNRFFASPVRLQIFKLCSALRCGIIRKIPRWLAFWA